MLGGRDANPIARQHRRARRIADVLYGRGNSSLSRNEAQPFVRSCGLDGDRPPCPGVEANAFKMQRIAKRRLHHAALFRLAQTRALQSFDTIKQLWQPPNHDLSAEFLAMVVRRISGNRRAVPDVSPDAGVARDRHARPDREMTAKTHLSRHLHAIADYRRACQSGQCGDDAMLADATVVADLHEVVDLRTAPDLSAADLRAVDAGVCADLHLVLEHDVADLRDSFGAPVHERP